MKKKINFFNIRNKLIIFLLLIIIVPYIFTANQLLDQVTNIEQNFLIIFEIFALIAIIIVLIFSNQLSYISNGDFKKNIPLKMLKRKETQEEMKENLNFLQTLLDTIPSPVFAKDENGVYNQCNIAFTEYLGIDEEKIIGHNIYEICEKNLADIYNKADKDLMQTKGKQIYEAKVVYNDGTKHDVIFNKAAIINGEGEYKGMVGIILDVTKEKITQEKINKLLKLKEIMLQIGYFTNETYNTNELFKLILDKVIECIGMGNHGTILVLDNNKLKIAVSKGYREDEIENFSLDLEDSIGWIFTNGQIDKTIIVNNIDDIKEINIIDTVDGFKIKSIISAPIIVNNKLYGFINLDSDNYNAFGETEFELMEYVRFQLSVTISKYKLYEETIYLSKYDKLTNLYNRSYFEQLVHTDISDAIKKGNKLLVVILDLNGLKFVNDSYGHLAGDKFIINFASELKNCGNGSDIIARFGGDEFIGVFYNRSLDNLTNYLENLIKNFQDNPISFENKKFICSFSYGISSFPEDDDDFNNLVKIADERMYEYKRKRFYDHYSKEDY